MARAKTPQFRLLMLALALTCACGWLFKSHCAPGGWTDSEQYTTGCYSDAVPFWTARQVADGYIPYFQSRMEYPVLTGAAIWIEGTVARAMGPFANAMGFLTVVTLANALLAALVLRLFWGAGMEPIRLWFWALAPPLVLYVGHNWDMLAVTFAVVALLFARKGLLARAGIAGGLGVVAKLYPALLLPLVGLQALFGEGDWTARIRRAAVVTAVTIAAWALVNLPVAILAYDNWSEFYRFSGERLGTAASTWEILGRNGLWLSIADRNLWSAITFLGGAALIVGIGWRRHRAHLWVLFTPVLAWFLLTNKVYSPQFDLWLYPMLLMTAPRLRPVALFVIAGGCAYFAEFWWFAGMEDAWPYATTTDIAIAAGSRAVTMLWLITDAVRLPAPAWIAGPPRTPA